MNGFSLPTKKDWAWVLGLVLAGCLLGLLINTASPKGINLRIALGIPEAGAQP